MNRSPGRHRNHPANAAPKPLRNRWAFGPCLYALEYAKKYPQYVSHIVLIGASPDYSAATVYARMSCFEKDAALDRKAAFDKSMAQLPAKITAEPDRRFVHMCVCAGSISWYDYTFEATSLWDGVYADL